MKQSFQTAGMHCKSCEIILKDNIEELAWAQVRKISYAKNYIEVEFRSEQDIAKIYDIITASGYSPNTAKEALPLMLRFVLLTLSFTLFIVFLQLIKIFPSFWQNGEINFVVAFFVGLIASVSTCFAVTGWIIIGYTENLIDTSNGLFTQLKFQLWRFTAFLIGGALLGLLWETFQISLSFTVILNIIVGYILLQMGLKGIWLFPQRLSLGLYIPGKVSQYINALKHPRYAPVVGALTFFLPCGFTQSMQILAISSGSPLLGMMILGAFALGTFPVLFGIGVWVEFIKDKLKIFNPFISVLLIVFGLFTLTGGISLARSILPVWNISQDETSTENIVSENLETEIVEVGHNGSQFVPNTITLKKGKNYILRVTPERDGLGCMFALAYNRKVYYIKKWETFDLEVNGSNTRKIPLVCASMGMRQGQIIIK